MSSENIGYEKELKNLLETCSDKLCEQYEKQGGEKWKAATAGDIRLIFPHKRVAKKRKYQHE